MSRLEEDLEQAVSGSDHQLKTSLNVLKRQIDGKIQNERAVPIELLNSTEAEHPLFEALRYYRKWVDERDYTSGARIAFERYEEAIEQALNDQWYSVASWTVASYIELATKTSNEEKLSHGIEEGVGLLEEEYSEPDVHEGEVGRIIDAISEADLRTVDSDLIDRVLDLCEMRAEYSADNSNFHAQRDYLRSIGDIQDQIDRAPIDAEAALIDSYNAELQVQRRRGHLVTAATLEAALSECAEFADEETLNDWRIEKREANRKGAEEEMKSIGVEMDENPGKGLDEIADKLVQNFRETVRKKSAEEAFLGLVAAPIFLPQQGEPASEQSSGESEYSSVGIRDLIGERLMTYEGDSVPGSASDLDINDRYKISAQFGHVVLVRVLYRIRDEGLIREHHFYNLIASISGATDSDRAFLGDFIRAFFDERHPEAIHLGMPRLEGLMKHKLENSGIAVTTEKQGEDLPKSFGGLLNRLEGTLDDDYVIYLKYRYVDPAGPEIRNQISHGTFRYQHAHFDISASILAELFRSSIQIDLASS